MTGQLPGNWSRPKSCNDAHLGALATALFWPTHGDLAVDAQVAVARTSTRKSYSISLRHP
ncbi:hypothetical protein P4233_01685 [Pseudomonas aeruginosa]|nr:hypothetical protein [Pseudomonas aeruginosa]